MAAKRLKKGKEGLHAHVVLKRSDFLKHLAIKILRENVS